MNPFLLPKLVLLATLVSGGVSAYADEAGPPASSSSPSLIEKVEKPIERGAKAAASGIEKGVTAGAHGVARGAHAAASGVERGAKAAARGIEKGAAATAHAVKTVASKVTGTTASEPAPAASH